MSHGQRRLHFISTAKNAVVTVQENVAVTVQVAADVATAVAVYGQTCIDEQAGQAAKALINGSSLC